MNNASIILYIILWIITILCIGTVLSFVIKSIITHLPTTKKYIVTIEYNNRYEVWGIYGFSDNHIKKKINKLVKMGYSIETRFGNNREVKMFPTYLAEIY